MRRLLATLAFDPAWQRVCHSSALVIYLLIVVLGSIPGAREEVGEFAPGVVLHSLAYAGLALLLFVGGRGDRPARAIKSMTTIAAMGAFDEFVQSFFPYRTASVWDWGVDVAAAALACSLLWSFWPELRSQASAGQ
ncbi:MAG TPA: VanZ family protein [Rhodocyclaceae bacterium]